MGLPYLEVFCEQDSQAVVLCNACYLPLCYKYEVIRDDYQCQSGKAYFVAQV